MCTSKKGLIMSNINKITGVISDAKAKVVKVGKKALQQQVEDVAQKAAKIDTQQVLSQNVSTKSTTTLADALKAQALADYQYAPNSDLLGCDKDSLAIAETLKYCHLERVKDLIKTGKIYTDYSKHEASIMEACKQYGDDKVLAEVNAALEKSHIINDSGLTHKKAIHSSLVFNDSSKAKFARAEYELEKKATNKPVH